jgi:hypothetical protein
MLNKMQNKGLRVISSYFALLSILVVLSVIAAILHNIRSLETNAEGRPNIVNVCQEEVLSGALTAFQRISFRADYPLSVKFVGEHGIDAGGPFREFCCLVLREIGDSNLFIGADSSKSLYLDRSGKAYL